MKKLLLSFSLWVFFQSYLYSQEYRWQQKVDYRMQVHLDVQTNRFTGQQTLFYFNNSPDTLHRLFYHLYLNAFQPGSMMDVRSQNLPDPDARVTDRISRLKPDEIGYLKIIELKQDGMAVKHHTEGTILEVDLAAPLAPHSVTILEMEFLGQVPLQIRRTGRDNAEGISYSMAQWYPKLCEYDKDGWHADPYVAREFYGVWGNFDVKITLNQAYTVAATGVLQNPEEVGHGYGSEDIKHKRKEEITWHFIARNVHDFVWAADEDYTHRQIVTEDGTTLRFFYQETARNKEAWEALPSIMVQAWSFIIRRYGPYPFKTYSFIQGGDGGMEYPMATLITGAERSVGSLVGVSVHELMHSWYQMMLATNESLYAWMDEGFTTFASTEVMNELRRTNSIPGTYSPMPFVDLYNGLRNLIKSGREEALSTHADHFNTNYAYGNGSYTKGAVFLKQLEYIVGTDVFDKALLQYYYQWRFKHPDAEDFIRIFEKESGMELDWYLQYFIQSTRVIEYQIEDIKAQDDKTAVTLRRVGSMPMPVDVEVTYKDGSVTRHSIPLRMMLGEKEQDMGEVFEVEPDWPWTHPTYLLHIDQPINKVKSVRIDPSLRLADFELGNNYMELEEN